MSHKCKCKVCGKRFDYGDEQSPVLKDSIWRIIVEKFNLTQYEREANARFFHNYSHCLGYIPFRNNEHLFICYECMEKALGRKLIKDDLISQNVPLNKEFEKHYFTNPIK